LKKIVATIPSFLLAVAPVFAQEEITIPQPSQVKITSIGPLISAFISLALIAAAIAALFFLILGGLQWSPVDYLRGR